MTSVNKPVTSRSEAWGCGRQLAGNAGSNPAEGHGCLSLVNPLNPELNPICYLLALLAHHFLHVSRIRVKSLTIRLLMSYIYIWSAYS